jgi:hypothetical protein
VLVALEREVDGALHLGGHLLDGIAARAGVPLDLPDPAHVLRGSKYAVTSKQVRPSLLDSGNSPSTMMNSAGAMSSGRAGRPVL